MSGAYPSRTQRGFTLQELMVTLTIGGGVATGVSSLYGLVQDTKMTATVNEVVAHLHLARSEAIKRGHEMAVCASGDGVWCDAAAQSVVSWQRGYLVFADGDNDGELDAGEAVLRVRGELPGSLQVRSNRRGRLTYQPDGTAGVRR